MEELTKKERELYKRVDEVLHYLWDPIGISNTPGARDEYYGYLPTVFNYLNKVAPEEEMEGALEEFESQMGLTPNNDRISKVVEVLNEWKEKINKEE